jgi:DNA-binding NarL/FixJ family response regulator
VVPLIGESLVGVVIYVAHFERLVSALAIQGLKPPEISRRMGLSEKSVKKILENVARKIEAASAAERGKA